MRRSQISPGEQWRIVLPFKVSGSIWFESAPSLSAAASRYTAVHEGTHCGALTQPRAQRAPWRAS